MKFDWNGKEPPDKWALNKCLRKSWAIVAMSVRKWIFNCKVQPPLKYEQISFILQPVLYTGHVYNFSVHWFYWLSTIEQQRKCTCTNFNVTAPPILDAWQLTFCNSSNIGHKEQRISLWTFPSQTRQKNSIKGRKYSFLLRDGKNLAKVNYLKSEN